MSYILITAMSNWHQINPAETIELLNSDVNSGLSSNEANQRQQYFGKNELQETSGRRRLVILWDQFTNIMLVMLMVIAVISAILDLRQHLSLIHI
jgi:Ca2+-transporting ATPase